MIINQLTFLLLSCLLGWSSALIRPVPGISTLDRDGRTLHRTKRGWMWNSFFLLEEWTGTGKQYVGKVRAVTLRVEKLQSLGRGIIYKQRSFFTPYEKVPWYYNGHTMMIIPWYSFKYHLNEI